MGIANPFWNSPFGEAPWAFLSARDLIDSTNQDGQIALGYWSSVCRRARGPWHVPSARGAMKLTMREVSSRSQIQASNNSGDFGGARDEVHHDSSNLRGTRLDCHGAF